ncbi:hypothetical protein V2J09_011911 [Rumex salicifolius]
MDPSAFSSPELEKLLSKQRVMVNEMVSKMTSACWDKCITSTPGSKFSSTEISCLTKCPQRYMDMSMMVMKRLQSMQ